MIKISNLFFYRIFYLFFSLSFIFYSPVYYSAAYNEISSYTDDDQDNSLTRPEYEQAEQSFHTPSSLTDNPTYLHPSYFSTMFKQKERFELLLLGETGTGKSTFINMAANYFLSGSFPSNIKVVIPTKFRSQTEMRYKASELSVSDLSRSQTSKPTKYPFNYTTREIVLVDTPGLGDTRGIGQDQNNLDQITETASNLEHLSGIIVFFNGSQSRETTSLSYVLGKLKGSIPDVAFKNIMFVFTNCREDTCHFPQEIIDRFQITSERLFYMNNTAFTSDPSKWSTKTLPLLKSEWDQSIDTIRHMMDHLSASSKDIQQAFKKMRRLRNKVMASLHETRGKITEIQQIHEIVGLFEQEHITSAAEAASYSDYAKKAIVQTRKFIEDRRLHHSTICTKHTLICHDSCSLDETTVVGAQIFTGCAAFYDKKGNCCRVCYEADNTSYCSYQNHYHARGYIQNTTFTVEEKLAELKARYDSASATSQAAQAKLQTAQESLLAITNIIATMKDEIAGKCHDLKKICTGFNFVRELEDMISILEKDADNLRSIKARQSALIFIDSLKLIANQLSADFDTAPSSSLDIDSSSSNTNTTSTIFEEDVQTLDPKKISSSTQRKKKKKSRIFGFLKRNYEPDQKTGSSKRNS